MPRVVDSTGVVADVGLTAHLTDAVAAHAASAVAFTPNGSIAATDVQAAIVEVRDEAGSGIAVLFDSTLGSDTASIDTGAGGIAGGYDVLEVWMILRTDQVLSRPLVDITINDDGSSIYDIGFHYSNYATLAGGGNFADSRWQMGVHGNTDSAGYPSVIKITLPGYDQTTFWKTGEALVTLVDATTTKNWTLVQSVGYRATTAISRVKVAAQGAQKLQAGSRLLIYGR